MAPNTFSVPKDRIILELKCAETVFSGFIYEIGPVGVKIFSSKKINLGESVSCDVRTDEVSGIFFAKVTSAAELPSLGKIIKVFPYIWRLTLEFRPKSPEEQAFLSQLAINLCRQK